MAVSANSWVSKDFGLDRGFDQFLLLEESGDGHASAEDVNHRLSRSLSNLRPPYFLYVQYIDPHEPYNPNVSWDGSPLPARLVQRVPMTLKGLESGTPFRRSAEVLQDSIDLYDGAIREVDTAVASLLRTLTVAGLMKNTLTIVTADHGEEFGDHGRMSHGQTLYREVVQVPLVFHSPGQIPPNTRISKMSLLDVFDTTLDLLGIRPPPSERDGVSMADALLSGRARDGSKRSFFLHLDIETGSGLGLIQGNRKLLLAKKPFGKELFDLDPDPLELKNLFADPQQSRVAGQLLASLVETYNGYSAKSMRSDHARLSESTARKLMALGYLAPVEVSRRVPARISAPDMDPIGALGWENKGKIESCIQVAEAGSESQLLSGWSYPELQGRWTEPRASLLLRVPRTESRPIRLLLEGESFRPDAPRIKAVVENRVLLDRVVDPGEFRIESDLNLSSVTDPLLIALIIEPAFEPTKHGSQDHRTLGIFLRSVCLDGRLPKPPSIGRDVQPAAAASGSSSP
jgi:sulfatase-like protein